MIGQTYHLLGDHNDGLQTESAIAVVKEILKGGTEKIDDQDVMQTFLAEVVDIGDPGCR